jgi:F-box interacting protein
MEHAMRSTRVMFVSDPLVGSFTDLEDHQIDQPHLLGNPGMFRCSQPCHGLILGSRYHRDYLYNPTMGYREGVYVEEASRDDTSFAGRIALGYDYEISDHVMVSLAYEKMNMETRYYNLHCHVRSLRGSWDLVDPPPRPVAIDVLPAYSNGKIYWVVEPKLGPCSAVSQLVAFNTWDREFEVLQGPPCSNFASRRVSILELYDSICMACYDEDKNAIDVWRMKDNEGTWCVECRIELEEFSPEYSSQRTMLLSSDPVDGRILLNTGRSLGYYDPKTATLETIYTVGDQVGDFGFCPDIVQDSLVRPFMKQTD